MSFCFFQSNKKGVIKTTVIDQVRVGGILNCMKLWFDHFIVRKMNSWPRIEATRATGNFEDNVLANWKWVYLFYNDFT